MLQLFRPFKTNEESVRAEERIELAEIAERYQKRRGKHERKLKQAGDRLGGPPTPVEGTINSDASGRPGHDIFIGFIYTVAAIVVGAGEYAFTYQLFSVFPLPESIKQMFSAALSIVVVLTGEWYVWAHLDWNWLRARSFYMYRVSQRASSVCLSLSLVVYALLGAVRGFIFAANLSLRLGWQSRLPFLASVASVLIPVLMTLAAIIVSGALVFCVHFALEHLTRGGGAWVRAFMRSVRVGRVEKFKQKLRHDDAWRRKKVTTAREEANMRIEGLRKSGEQKVEQGKTRQKKYDEWHVDPKKVKGNGSQTTNLSSLVGFLVPLAFVSSLNCGRVEESSKTHPERMPIDVVVIFDLSGSQSDEKEANKAVLASIAENLGLGDHFRVVPIDQSSEGQNETLVEVTIPQESGSMDFDLLGARNEARQSATDIDKIVSHRGPLTGGTSVIGSLNTPAVLDQNFERLRRFIIVLSDLEEASWEANFYGKFDPTSLVDSLSAAGRVPDLHDRELWVAGATDAHVGPIQEMKIRKFWTLFGEKSRCVFRWFGYDRALLTSELTKIQKQGQPVESW